MKPHAHDAPVPRPPQPRRRPRLIAPVLALVAMFGAGTLVACEGCRSSTPKPPVDGAATLMAPTLRLYLVSDLAGALEPCGCVKDQLGGLDHAAAYISGESNKPAASALVSVGPLFFMDPQLKDDRRAQEIAKAHTLASSLAGLGLVAFTPGKNDWAAGTAELSSLAKDSGGSMLVANASIADGKAPWIGSVVRALGSVKVGFIGVASLDDASVGKPLDGVTVSPAREALRREIEAVRKQGAQVLVALGAVGRGEAKRIAEFAPELTAVVVGSSAQAGDVNSETPLPEKIGNVLVAETGNHLQTVGVLDLFVRGDDFGFEDGGGLEQAQKQHDLMRRIDELRGRIATWERDGKVSQQDLAARRADLSRLEAEKKAADAPTPPASGSYYRFSIVEVRDGLGKDDAVGKKMLAYYKQVNDANKVAFASKLPKSPAAPEPGYVGIDRCTACHAEARAVWDKTAHRNAYTTLSTQFKEFNLDCVSCHVTGYDRPGGSTVAHVDKLQAVQCEVCHGPGSKHADNPMVAPPVPRPGGDVCTSCHHPPHVHTFDPIAKMPEILGPGHGGPK